VELYIRSPIPLRFLLLKRRDTLSSLQCINIWTKWIWNEAVVNYFKVLSQILLRIRKTTKNLRMAGL
jgi:hypothetical protein